MILAINKIQYLPGDPHKKDIIVFLGPFWGPPSYANYQTVAKVYLAESSVDLSDQTDPLHEL